MKTQNADQSPGHGLAQPKPSAKFVKAHDRIGHPILGLWQRGRRFYFQTQLSGERSCRKIPLKTEDNLPAADVKEAQAAIVAFRAELARGRAVICRSPRFDEFAEHYKAHVTELGIKTARTILNEKSTITGWKKFFGPTRLDQISIQHILDYATQRRKDGVSSRTVNVDVIVLSSVLKLAVQEKKLARRVTDEWEPLLT